MLMIILLLCCPAFADDITYTNADVHRAIHESREQVLFSTNIPTPEPTPALVKKIRKNIRDAKKAQGRITCGDGTGGGTPGVGHQETCFEIPDSWKWDSLQGEPSGTPA